MFAVAMHCLPTASGEGNKDVSRQCATSLFSSLIAACNGNIATTTSGDLGGLGSDPVFNARSAIYDKTQNVSDWYNTSVEAGVLLRF